MWKGARGRKRLFPLSLRQLSHLYIQPSAFTPPTSPLLFSLSLSYLLYSTSFHSLSLSLSPCIPSLSSFVSRFHPEAIWLPAVCRCRALAIWLLHQLCWPENPPSSYSLLVVVLPLLLPRKYKRKTRGCRVNKWWLGGRRDRKKIMKTREKKETPKK